MNTDSFDTLASVMPNIEEADKPSKTSDKELDAVKAISQQLDAVVGELTTKLERRFEDLEARIGALANSPDKGGRHADRRPRRSATRSMSEGMVSKPLPPETAYLAENHHFVVEQGSSRFLIPSGVAVSLGKPNSAAFARMKSILRMVSSKMILSSDTDPRGEPVVSVVKYGNDLITLEPEMLGMIRNGGRSAMDIASGIPLGRTATQHVAYLTQFGMGLTRGSIHEVISELPTPNNRTKGPDQDQGRKKKKGESSPAHQAPVPASTYLSDIAPYLPARLPAYSTENRIAPPQIYLHVGEGQKPPVGIAIDGEPIEAIALPMGKPITLLPVSRAVFAMFRSLAPWGRLPASRKVSEELHDRMRLIERYELFVVGTGAKVLEEEEETSLLHMPGGISGSSPGWTDKVQFNWGVYPIEAPNNKIRMLPTWGQLEGDYALSQYKNI